MSQFKTIRSIIAGSKRKFVENKELTKSKIMREKLIDRGYEMAKADILEMYDEYMSSIVNTERQFLYEAYGLSSYKVNEYHTKIIVENPRTIYDWYNTTGKLLKQRTLIGVSLDSEEVANLIKDDLTKCT